MSHHCAELFESINRLSFYAISNGLFHQKRCNKHENGGTFSNLYFYCHLFAYFCDFNIKRKYVKDIRSIQLQNGKSSIGYSVKIGLYK